LLVRARPLSPPWLVSLCGAVLPGHAAVGPLTHTYPPDEVHGGPPALRGSGVSASTIRVPCLVRVLIRSPSNSATVARTLKSARPAGSMGSHL